MSHLDSLDNRPMIMSARTGAVWDANAYESRHRVGSAYRAVNSSSSTVGGQDLRNTHRYWILKESRGNNPFLSAAKNGDLEELQRNWVQEEKEGALCVAITFGQLNSVRYLIEECGIHPEGMIEVAKKKKNNTEVLDYLLTEPEPALTKQKLYEMFLEAFTPPFSAEQQTETRVRVLKQILAKYSYEQLIPLTDLYEQNLQAHPLLIINIDALPSKIAMVEPIVDDFIKTTLTNFVISSQYYDLAEAWFQDEDWSTLFAHLRGETEIPMIGNTPEKKVKLQMATRLNLYSQVCDQAMESNNIQVLLMTFNEMPDSPNKDELRPNVEEWLAKQDQSMLPSAYAHRNAGELEGKDDGGSVLPDNIVAKIDSEESADEAAAQAPLLNSEEAS